MMSIILLVIGILFPFADAEHHVIADYEPLPTFQLAMAYSSVDAPIAMFDSMNEISLADNMETVIDKRGEPDQVTYDKITGYTEYAYPDITVGFYDDIVYYVQLQSTEQSMNLNGHWIQLQEDELQRSLGTVDFEADDGDVYIRGLAAVKIYRDSDTDAVIGVDLFDTVAF